MLFEIICNFQDFNLEQVYELFNSPYGEIQKLALDVITDLVRRNQDERLQEHFRRTKGLEALLKFLDVKILDKKYSYNEKRIFLLILFIKIYIYIY